MPFITQGKTNLKYILIVIILALIAGGGILWWQKVTQKEMLKLGEFSEMERPKESLKEAEIAVKNLIHNFYKAVEDQDGELVMSYFTPPVTPEEKESYDWLTGADLPVPGYRIFMRVRIANFSIETLERMGANKFEVRAIDEFQWYSNVTAEWSEPILRDVLFIVVKKEDKWLVDKYIHILEDTTKQYRVEKYSGFGHEEIVTKDESAGWKTFHGEIGDFPTGDTYKFEFQTPSEFAEVPPYPNLDLRTSSTITALRVREFQFSSAQWRGQES